MTPLRTFTRLCLLLPLSLALANAGCEPGSPPDENAGLYHTYAEVGTGLKSLAGTHATLARVESIGKSVQGRDLWAIKISDNVNADESEPVVVFMGCHHAREWISVDVPYLLAEHLLQQYGADTSITRLVNQAEIWMLPMLNPDGHEYSVRRDRLWRKNRRNNGDGTFGVDLNRNYGHKWGGPGSSGDTFSEIYRGPAPFSEPETQAAREFLQQHTPVALITYHNFSQLILYPWGHTNAPPPDEALLDQLASAMADKIRSVHGKRYRPQQASSLYLASGDTVDWLYGVFSVPGFTFELRPRSSLPGFRLPESEIRPTFEENLPAALFLIDWVIKNRAGGTL